MNSRELADSVRKWNLLPESKANQAELTQLQRQHADAKPLARALLKRNLLTPYQANQVLKGKGRKLVVGPYRILMPLGEGASAQVFKALHFRMNRIVALKLIHDDSLINSVSVERFLRESEMAAAMAHPNIVRAYDADEMDEGYFFAMEYIHGKDLLQLAKRKPMAIDRACNYIMQAARGLQYIHENGMVHRDIKPGNLMVSGLPEMQQNETPTGETRTVVSAVEQHGGPWGLVKILDLGLARLQEDPSAPNQRAALTKVGTVMGTPDYMAPEQAIQSRNADIRSDIYSLGCTFYLLLTGQPPYPGGNAVEKMLKHQLDTPRPVEEIRNDVSANVSAIIKKMLAKQPKNRFQTPSEVAQALEKLGAVTTSPAARTVDVRAPEPNVLPESQSLSTDTAAPPTDGLPLAPRIVEEFEFEEANSPVHLAATRVAQMRSEQAERRMWIILACAGTAALLFVLLIVALLSGH